jgi:hypothetical protein
MGASGANMQFPGYLCGIASHPSQPERGGCSRGPFCGLGMGWSWRGDWRGAENGGQHTPKTEQKNRHLRPSKLASSSASLDKNPEFTYALKSTLLTNRPPMGIERVHRDAKFPRRTLGVHA